jgi:hypothetical protein
LTYQKNARAPLPLSLSHTLRVADDFQIRTAAPDPYGRRRCSTMPSTGGAPPLHLPSVMPATASGALGGARPPPCTSAPQRQPSSSVPQPPTSCPHPRRCYAHTHARSCPSFLRPAAVVRPRLPILPQPPVHLQPPSSARGRPSILSRPHTSSQHCPPMATHHRPAHPPARRHPSLFTLRPPASLCSKSPPMKTPTP